MFQIEDYVELDDSRRAVCPSCEQDGKGKKKNLSVAENGAYKCHRGCTTEDIRSAIGQPKVKTTPISQRPQTPPKSAQSTPQQVKAAHEKLITSDGPAKKWLIDRGISEAIIKRHKLGISGVRIGKKRHWAISIPIPTDDGTHYHVKKRVAPWDESAKQLSGYMSWKQYGIPKRVFFTHKPENATQTFLCEGEWDAMMLADLVIASKEPIAVCCFTCGCSNVPDEDELKRLPGQVFVFYDRNDEPLKNGDRPGDVGANKAALAIDGAKIANVPMSEDCDHRGWDVSDALNGGYDLAAFLCAIETAFRPKRKKTISNHLLSELVWNDDLIDKAPDYTEFLVPDLLTEDELFLLAAGPRTGKSLMAMTLAKAVATGGQFMGRPCTQGTVLYVKCEDSDTKIKEREAAQGWERGLPVAWLNDFKLSDVKALEEVVEEIDPRLLVLDTLSRIKDSAISESSAEMSQLLEPLQRIANKHGVCVLLVHHTGKVSVDNANQDIFDTIRGSSAIRAVCRGSMVLAAGEHDYRLVVENGWGKHDLKVVLDANTLTWKQLGAWSPPVNMSQQELIIEALKKIGSGSVDQIHQETGIPKKSLYEQLSRLINSEDPNCKVIKEGVKRKYTYRLALFNYIQQLNSVLNSENARSDCDKGPIQQNTFFPENSEPPQNSTTSHVTVERSKMGGRNFPLNKSSGVEYRPSNADTESNTRYSTDIQQYSVTDTISTTGEVANMSRVVPVVDDPTWDDENGITSEHFGPKFQVGDRVRYVGTDATRCKLSKRRKLIVKSEVDGIAVVDHAKWEFTQSIPVEHLIIAQ